MKRSGNRPLIAASSWRGALNAQVPGMFSPAPKALVVQRNSRTTDAQNTATSSPTTSKCSHNDWLRGSSPVGRGESGDAPRRAFAVRAQRRKRLALANSPTEAAGVPTSDRARREPVSSNSPSLDVAQSAAPTGCDHFRGLFFVGSDPGIGICTYGGCVIGCGVLALSIGRAYDQLVATIKTRKDHEPGKRSRPAHDPDHPGRSPALGERSPGSGLSGITATP